MIDWLKIWQEKLVPLKGKTKYDKYEEQKKLWQAKLVLLMGKTKYDKLNQVKSDQPK